MMRGCNHGDNGHWLWESVLYQSPHCENSLQLSPKNWNSYISYWSLYIWS